MSIGVFADSSALVKLYADEPDHADVRELPHLVVSQLARVEVPAALWRKHRMGEIPTAATAVLVADFEADYFGDADQPPRFSVVAITPTIIDTAARLVGIHGLRAYDAVQLASALAVVDAVPEGIEFLAYDGALTAAAASEGLRPPALRHPR
ncbi:type II toxin-antitoxin system VapC family toxin [Mycobacterium sp. M1]|uniref:Type II toxin-antitoxin system VapC family toxin n=1 Tax=Mycolicibacter acidiphilus TaxID=2835306 RepID=A0ABS5RI91_9MYCO|nr:type II toxin-antitoxin system VapC family toxin [Mycolicibacter acidiphilus]MBS9533319.1 type II toxin-antitoxin system VapC family toxin [Mycolicibacter acidiphilus]